MTDTEPKESVMNKSTRWFVSYWRPVMAWVYCIVVLFDFIIAPIGNIIITHLFGLPYIEWQPLTLQGGGVFHLSFGAILGVSAYGQQRENIANIRPGFPPSPYPQPYPPQPNYPVAPPVIPPNYPVPAPTVTPPSPNIPSGHL
jgi:hypothetical protein